MDFKHRIAEWIAEAADLDPQLVYAYLEVPPNREMGDLAFPCFKLSKQLRQPPLKIAEDIRMKITARLSDPARAILSDCAAAGGGYLNFFINRGVYIRAVLGEIRTQGARYGASGEGAGKRVIIEFSSPNIAKPFHIGHLFSTALGNALARIHRFLGYETVAINHLGDWGTQFGKLISAYKRWGDADALQKDTIHELLRVYVKYHQEVRTHPELDDEARTYFRLLEEGEPEIKAQWQAFRDYSLREFDRVYRRLGIAFDASDGESFYSDKMDGVVAALREKHLLQESDGAQMVDLSDENLPPCMILKSDGATIYATRDLAAAIYRRRTYHFDKNIYVVGIPQTLHFRQVFGVLRRMGLSWYQDCVHVGFGLVKFPDRQMATREGEIVFLEEVFDESVKRAARMMDADRGVANPEQVAETVGVGAIVYAFLKNSRERDIIFSWEELLDLEGESGPYVQYTYARATSVLRRAETPPAADAAADADAVDGADCALLTEAEEYALVSLLGEFPRAVAEAAQKYEPSILTRHITAIARAFNKFYHYHKILDAAPGLREARIQLCRASRQIIGQGLALLGIGAPEQM